MRKLDSPISISRSNLPGRRRAGSIPLGLLVAPITNTLASSCPIPSINVNSVATTLFSTSPPSPSLLGHRASTSSSTTTHGLRFFASSKTALNRSSVSPWKEDDSSGPLMTIHEQLGVLDATALARAVLPVPGGPYRRTPLGGAMPNSAKDSG